MSCITTSEIAIMANGTQTPFFSPRRGIRQGDLLSLYLFILCMKRLSRKIKRSVLSKDWSPIKISKYEPPISHLFFADDIILTVKANQKNCDAIAKILKSFGALSGQQVNKAKSKILFSRNSPKDIKKHISENLGIKSSTDIGKYLGFPIINKRSSAKDFQFIIDNLQSKLAGWKKQFLNITGRTTLAKASLSSIPNHVMQFTKLPSSILKKIDQIQRNFIWGSSPFLCT